MTTQDLTFLRRTIALLSSMIEGGEQYTARSREMKNNALDKIEDLQTELSELTTKDNTSEANLTIPDIIVSVCPQCQGSGKDGHDRCDPPNWYICEKCNGSGQNEL